MSLHPVPGRAINPSAINPRYLYLQIYMYTVNLYLYGIILTPYNSG